MDRIRKTVPCGWTNNRKNETAVGKQVRLTYIAPHFSASEMTYTVSSGALNSTHSLLHFSGVFITDRAGVQPRPQQPKPAMVLQAWSNLSAYLAFQMALQLRLCLSDRVCRISSIHCRDQSVTPGHLQHSKPLHSYDTGMETDTSRQEIHEIQSQPPFSKTRVAFRKKYPGVCRVGIFSNVSHGQHGQHVW